MDNIIPSRRCGKTIEANKLYNETLRKAVDKMPINPNPPFAVKVWHDENGEISTKIVNIFK